MTGTKDLFNSICSMAEKNDSLDQQATDLQLALAEVYEQIIS